MQITLGALRKGQRATVVSIRESALKSKLMELGLIAHTEVTVLFQAPFGDPIAIDIQGFVLSLRKSEADLIEVEPLTVSA